jgi:hypothetical protein
MSPHDRIARHRVLAMLVVSFAKTDTVDDIAFMQGVAARLDPFGSARHIHPMPVPDDVQ